MDNATKILGSMKDITHYFQENAHTLKLERQVSDTPYPSRSVSRCLQVIKIKCEKG